MENVKLTLSVHQLVDFLLRRGDIDTRIFNRSSMNEGSRMHAYYQSRQGDNYIVEYPFKHLYHVDGYDIILQGRADGIIKNDDGSYTVDEIKTSVIDLPTFRKENIDWHLGQAKCYAFMFAEEHKLDTIGVKLSYFRQGHNEKLFDSYTFTFLELKKFVFNLFYAYLSFYSILERKLVRRGETSKNLHFPFDHYRDGQKKMAKYVYSVGKNGGNLFVQAPTGIGKTMSTLYPYVKLLDDDANKKIFYLTAKNSGRESAYNAIQILKQKGLDVSEILITAKDKICLCQGKACNPDECPYTIGYYNKLQEIIKDMFLKGSDFNFETIVQVAKEKEVCPFELELDLSLYCDIIICDYNYMFDPLVYMKRYFDEDSSQFLTLIDEAHNLVDRSKDMYSASLSYNAFKEAKKSLKSVDYKPIKKIFTKLNKMYKEYEEIYPDENTIIPDLLPNSYNILQRFYVDYQDMSKNENKLVTKELTDFFLEVNKFLKIFEYFDDSFLLYVHRELDKKKGDTIINFKCMDASTFLKRTTRQVHSSIFFSATLSPFNYYADLLGGNKNEDPYLSLPSPFPKENLLLMVAPNISTKYKKRNESYKEVVNYIKSLIQHKIGNYFIFAPSYEYLENLLPYLYDIENELDLDIIYQTRDMEDSEKDQFIASFKENPNKTMIALAVIGGVFSEGIDLVNDRLIGAVVIGVGLPKVNFELNQTAKYYNSLGLSGRDYAYVNPGMNKVMQAVGRVIRSEEDQGVVLLIDERYTTNKYQEMFKEEWKNYKVVLNNDDIDKMVSTFFKK